MTIIDHFRLMAGYNSWMNGRIYAGVALLPAEEVARDRGAFFGSILGTLNHLVVTDTIWLRRMSMHVAGAPLKPVEAFPAPTALNQILFTSLADLKARRDALDSLLSGFVVSLDEADLEVPLTYRRVNGEAQRKRLGPLLAHLFNHQTHHRGQVTTLITQAGGDVGETDLLRMIPDLD